MMRELGVTTHAEKQPNRHIDLGVLHEFAIGKTGGEGLKTD